MRNYSSKGLLISIISMFLFLFSVELSSGSSYLELATEKVFSSGEKVYVTAASNNTHKIGIRVYQLNSPKDYLTKQKNIHYPRVNSKRRASSLLQINEDLKVKMTNQWQTFLRGNFNSKLRGDLTKSLALKDLSDAKPVKRDYSLFPVLKGYPLLRSFEHQLEKGKYYYNYSQIPLDLKKRGVYLIEGVYKNRAAYTVVIISDIAFVTKTYRTGRLIYVTNRKTGQPVKSANIEIYKDKKLLASGKTSSEGIFRYPSGKKEGSRVLIFAQKGKDFTLSDPYFYRKFFRSRAVVYIYTSRPVYRPGQEISFKAILRDNVDEIYRLPKAGSRVQVKIKDARQTVVYKKTLALNDFGTLSDKLKLPVSQSLGNYAININYQNNDYFYHFKVEKYKKPEYEVKVKTDKNLYIKGDVIRAKVKAKYYFGSPVTKGKVEYHVYRKRYFVPWWDTTYGWYYSASLAGSGGGSRSQEVLSGRNIDLKPDGSLDIVIDTKKIAAKYKDRFHFGRSTEPDYSYSISVTVVDQSRRHVSGSKSFLLTRSDHHLKLSTGRWLYSPNKPIDIKIQAKRFDGSFLKGKKVRVEFYQELWERSFGKYIYKTNLLNKQEGLTGKDGVLELSYTPSKPMWMIIKAISKDERGNITISRRHVYVYSSSQRSKRKGRGSITIITDKSGYKNGEHAQIVFNTPVQNGHLLVTCEISSIPFAKVIPINNGNASLKLKLVDAYTPNTWVNATMIFDNRLYTARKEIIVPPIQKFLSVSVQGNKKQYRPGEQAEFTIKATDYRGRPVRSEISVGIVDASIYGIAPERTPDIRKAFYTRKYNAVSTTSSLYFRFIGRFENRTLMSRLQNKADTKYGSYKEEDGKLKEARVRKDFKDEILWLPAVRTNHNGIARVKFNFPDNLTRWRTTVRSVTKDTMVGNVTQSTIVRKNLMVRLAIPRFYRENDKATVTTIVHNYLNKPKKVHLTLSTKGIQLTSPQKMSLTVPVNGIKKVDWQVQTKRAGMATFLVKALTDEESDALQQTVPVLPHGMKSMDPLVTELRKNSDKFFHNVILKDNYSPGHSELQVDIAPSLVVAMNAALPYLVKEPYGCVEQTMSRFMPLVLVDDLVKKTGYRDVNMKDKIATYYEKGINRLYNLQHPDGGWGWWNNDQSYPGMTAYALSGLLLAKKVGRPVRSDVISKGVKVLQRQISNKNIDITTRIFMLRALSMAGKASRQHVLAIYNSRRDLNPYSRAMLIEILKGMGDHIRAQVLMKELVASSRKGATGIYWEGKKWKYSWRSDSEETTANVVRAIAMVDKNQPSISPAIRWIMAQRREARWRSTRSTAIMIHALYDIANRRRELAPNYSARVYINGKIYRNIRVGAGQKSLKSYSFRIPESFLNKGINVVKIEKQGAGSLYYSSAFKYYERKPWFTAKDNGFSIERKYYRLVKENDSGEVRYRKVPVNKKVRSGDVILVELSVNAKNPRHEYVLVEDQLPSGCEVITKDRGYTVEGSSRYKGYRSWNERYYAAREVHDHRVGIALTRIPSARFKLEYLIRAEIPGDYRAMPATASLMYFPEVNGRSDEFHLQIGERP